MSIAISDAVKSLRHDSRVTITRVFVLTLFVASLLIVSKLMLSIYYEEKAKLDPATFREIRISATRDVDEGTGVFAFTDERLETLKKQNVEIDTIYPFYELLTIVQYNGKVAPSASLYSATTNDVLFEKERMLVGRGPQDENETTLTRDLANRLGVKLEDVKNGVEITTSFSRKRDQQEESLDKRLTVVGICRGSEEAGYVLTPLASKINAWQASDLASIDGRLETKATEALVYYKAEQFQRIEEFANNAQLVVKPLEPQADPNLKNSTWARVAPIEPLRNDLLARKLYPTWILERANDLFVVIGAKDERIQLRNQTIDTPDDGNSAFSVDDELGEGARQDATERIEENVEERQIDQKPQVRQENYVKNDGELREYFGITPQEGVNVQIVSYDERASVVFDDGTSLDDLIAKSEKTFFVKLDADVKEDADFYQKACFYNAIAPCAAQTFRDLNLCEVKATGNTPKETANALVENLKPLARYVKERIEIEALINKRFVKLTGKDSKAPENKNKRDEEFEGTRALELSVEDARELGAIDLPKGSDVVLSFTSETNQTIELTFRYAGLNVFSEIPSEDAKDIRAWQRGELVYDESAKKFVVPSLEGSTSKTYDARIIAKSTEDALILTPKLREKGFRVESSVDDIENAKRLASNIASFILLSCGVSSVFCVLIMTITGSLMIRLKEKDVAVMLETGVGRMEIFKEIFAETIITSGIAYILVVALTLTLGKAAAKGILALMNTTLESVAFVDKLGVELLLVSGALVLALAFVAQLSSIGVLMRCKRPLR